MKFSLFPQPFNHHRRFLFWVLLCLSLSPLQAMGQMSLFHILKNLSPLLISKGSMMVSQGTCTAYSNLEFEQNWARMQGEEIPYFDKRHPAALLVYKSSEVPPSKKPVLILTGQNKPLKEQEEIGELLGTILGHVIVVKNETQGTLLDTFRSWRIKFKDRKDAQVDQILRLLKGQIGPSPTSIIAHSQGTIHLAKALKELTPQEREELTVITFGDAVSPQEWPEGPNYHHIINKTDPVVRIASMPILVNHRHYRYIHTGTMDHNFLKYWSYNQEKVQDILTKALERTSGNEEMDTEGKEKPN